MKKFLLVVAVLAVAVVIFGAGIVFAQYQTASAQSGTLPYGPGGMMGGRGGMMGGRGGYGPMQNYVEQALAAKLGLTEKDIEDQFAAGKTMYQIAIDAGTAEADVAALFNEVHQTAFAKAVADGVMTQAQADLMLQNMQNRWANGAPCLDGTQTGQGYGPGSMMGGRGGRGGGMMGGYWNQQQAPQNKP